MFWNIFYVLLLRFWGLGHCELIQKNFFFNMNGLMFWLLYLRMIFL